MSEKHNNELSSWLVKRPIMFAIISFFALVATSAIVSLLGGRATGTVTNIMQFAVLLGAVTWLLRKLPAANLDRRSFVSINTAQTIITSVALIVSALVIFYNAQTIMMRLMFAPTHSTSIIFIVIALALFYLYLFGVFIGNLYAKYKRIRAMGVGMWKTLATAPFGFCMLWIPGYLMDDTSSNKKSGSDTGWYNRLINWILARPTHSAAALVLLIMMAGFTLGFNAILLTLGLGAVFAVWHAIVGAKKMRGHLNGAYAWTAIAINIVMILCIIGYVAIVRPQHNSHAPTPEIIQYVDTVQQQ